MSRLASKPIEFDSKVTVTLDADDPDRENLKTYKDRDLELTLRDITDKERVLQRLAAGPVASLEDVLAADADARREAGGFVGASGGVAA